MINRENYFTVKEYLSFLRDERQLSKDTVRSVWIGCKMLLEYADSKPLYDLGDIRPTLPEHLAVMKSQATGKSLCIETQMKALAHVRQFYTWAQIYKRGTWAKIQKGWVENLRVRRSAVNSSKEHKERVIWNYDDILTVAKYQPTTLQEERTQAAICFMFLSGMRVTAFCSMPVNCVDIQAGKVEQKPSKGVVTKNSKSAVTFLLPIPEILAIVSAWDAKVRAANSLYWFAPFLINPERPLEISGKEIKNKTFQGRRGLFDADLRMFCKKLELPVLSSHKLRHAHGVYGVRHAKTIEELKAVSQNMMHANVGITDGIYGNLPEENVKRVIATMTSTPGLRQNTTDEGQDLPADFVKFAKALYEKFKE